jgi:nuclear pore complex protein Nup93
MAVATQVETVKELFSSTTALLTELFESSRNLPTSTSDLGSIQLSLKEIQNRARSARRSDAHTNDTKAYV